MAQLMSIKKNVDVQPGVGVPAIFHCSQGDKGTRIILGLLNNNDNYTIPEDTTAIIRGSRADGTLFTEITADIDTATEIKFNLTEDMTSVAGPVECEAVMTSGSANVIGTANFIIDVERSPASIGSVFPGTDAAETWLIDELTNLDFSSLDNESVVDAINSKANESTIAPEFDSSASYTAGQMVLKNGVLYRFTADHTGAWTGSDAETVTVGGEITGLKSAIYQKTNLLPVEIKSITVNNVLVTFNNGLFTAVGTASSSGGRGHQFAAMTLPAGTYTLTFHNISVPSGTYEPVIYLMSGGSSALPTSLKLYAPNTFTFDSAKNVFIGVNFDSGRAYNFSAEIMIESGSNPTEYINTSGTAVDISARQNLGHITPEMYGAIGNGVADDTAAIQRALDSGNGYVLFGSGKTYLVSIGDSGYALDVKSNTTLDLNNCTIKLNKNSLGTYDMIRIAGKANVSIISGKIIGDADNHMGTDGEWGHCVNIGNSTNIRLYGSEITKAWGDGVYIGSNGNTGVCNNVYVDECFFHTNGRNNASCVACDRFVFSNCRFQSANRISPMGGIDVEPNANTIEYVKGDIENCQFVGNNIAIDIAFLSHDERNYVRVTNCNVDTKCWFYAYNKGKINVTGLKTSYSKGTPITITSDGSVVDIKNAVWYYGLENGNASYFVQLTNTAQNIHVDVDVYELATNQFVAPFLYSGSGDISNFTITCNVHAMCSLNDAPMNSGYCDGQTIKYDRPKILASSATIPSRGGYYVVSGNSGPITLPARVSTAQKGTEFIIWNKSEYSVNFQNIETIEPNHYVVFKAFDYGVVAKIHDYVVS